MRLDYTLYILAALLLIATIIPFVVTVEGVESEARSLWVVTTIVLGLLSIGLGYSQRPKTEAQACQPTVRKSQETMLQSQTVTTLEASKKEKPEVQIAKTATKKEPNVATPATEKMELIHVKGIGEKRAVQLKALGITSIDHLSKASAKTVAKKLKISPKTAGKWIESAKELVK